MPGPDILRPSQRPEAGRCSVIDERGWRWHLNWTRGFIRDFGWGEYLRVCWRDVWIYRLRNWRCWFGHDLGEPKYEYTGLETNFGADAWIYCRRPRCEFCKRDD